MACKSFVACSLVRCAPLLLLFVCSSFLRFMFKKFELVLLGVSCRFLDVFDLIPTILPFIGESGDGKSRCTPLPQVHHIDPHIPLPVWPCVSRKTDLIIVGWESKARIVCILCKCECSCVCRAASSCEKTVKLEDSTTVKFLIWYEPLTVSQIYSHMLTFAQGH